MRRPPGEDFVDAPARRFVEVVGRKPYLNCSYGSCKFYVNILLLSVYKRCHNWRSKRVNTNTMYDEQWNKHNNYTASRGSQKVIKENFFLILNFLLTQNTMKNY